MARSYIVVVLCVAMAAVLVMCVSCATQRDANPVIGTWTGVCDGEEMTITFNEDGSCCGVEVGKATNGSWIQKGGSVILTFEGEELYGSILSRQEMLLSEENPRRTIMLRKAR